MYGFVHLASGEFLLFDTHGAALAHANDMGLLRVTIRTVRDLSTPSVQTAAARRTRILRDPAAPPAASGEMAAFLGLGQ